MSPRLSLYISSLPLALSLIGPAFCQETTFQKICAKNICVKAEIADSAAKRRTGLAFRKSLDEQEGMLFVFVKETKPSFWMKNMEFPLDIIWIGRDKRIVAITAEAPPCSGSCESLVPKVAVKYVLEVNSGFSKRHGIKSGDKFEFE